MACSYIGLIFQYEQIGNVGTSFMYIYCLVSSAQPSFECVAAYDVTLTNTNAGVKSCAVEYYVVLLQMNR